MTHLNLPHQNPDHGSFHCYLTTALNVINSSNNDFLTTVCLGSRNKFQLLELYKPQFKNSAFYLISRGAREACAPNKTIICSEIGNPTKQFPQAIQ